MQTRKQKIHAYLDSDKTTQLEAIGRNGVMLAFMSSVSKTTIHGSAFQLAGHAS